MKTKPLVLTILLPLIVVGVNFAYRSQAITVTGKEYVYDVPQDLEKDFSSILYPGKIEGDDTGREALLLISHEDFPTIDLERPWEATLLFFWDKDYEADDRFVVSTRRLLKDAEPVGRSGPFEHYRDSLGRWQRDFYLHFSPEEGSGSGHYYYVLRSESEPIEIGEFRTTPRPSCSLHTVHDGIYARFTIHGPNCAIEKFDYLHAAVTAMFQTWQK